LTRETDDQNSNNYNKKTEKQDYHHFLLHGLYEFTRKIPAYGYGVSAPSPPHHIITKKETLSNSHSYQHFLCLSLLAANGWALVSGPPVLLLFI
jgi:hypothetical protein